MLAHLKRVKVPWRWSNVSLMLLMSSLILNIKIENCPKFILQHSHIYNLYDNWWNVFRQSRNVCSWLTASSPTFAALTSPILTSNSGSHWQTTPTFIFIFSLISRIFHHAYFNLLESNVMVYQAHILSKTINICQSQRYKFGYLFFVLQTYGFLLWDSYGYIYWRGNKRRMICWRFMWH